MAANAETEPGCDYQTLVESADEPGCVTMLEKFVSREAWDAHMETEHNQTGNQVLEPMLRPTVRPSGSTPKCPLSLVAQTRARPFDKLAHPFAGGLRLRHPWTCRGSVCRGCLGCQKGAGARSG